MAESHEEHPVPSESPQRAGGDQRAWRCPRVPLSLPPTPVVGARALGRLMRAWDPHAEACGPREGSPAAPHRFRRLARFSFASFARSLPHTAHTPALTPLRLPNHHAYCCSCPPSRAPVRRAFPRLLIPFSAHPPPLSQLRPAGCAYLLSLGPSQVDAPTCFEPANPSSS